MKNKREQNRGAQDLLQRRNMSPFIIIEKLKETEIFVSKTKFIRRSILVNLLFY